MQQMPMFTYIYADHNGDTCRSVYWVDERQFYAKVLRLLRSRGVEGVTTGHLTRLFSGVNPRPPEVSRSRCTTCVRRSDWAGGATGDTDGCICLQNQREMLPGLRGRVCVECVKYTSSFIFTHSLPFNTHAPRPLHAHA
jgi:hypothetical protein